jgi:GNAT superfamily N-acetyltransferase
MSRTVELREAARSYAVTAITRDGVPFAIRSIRPDDKRSLREAFQTISKETIYRRFFELRDKLSESDLVYFTEVDFVDHVALVATFETETGETGAGVGRYVIDRASDPLQAETALVVVDRYQNRGIGTQLLYHLACLARRGGVRIFTGEVLGENHKMMEVFLNSGYRIQRQVESGIIRVSFSIEAEGDGPPRVFDPAARSPADW